MKLYYSPAACSLSPHIVAREAGIALTLEKVDTKTHKTADGKDFYGINPKGYVPVLELDDGSLLTEGPAIVQYLADSKPASRLVPANGTMERYRQQEWLNFITAELHKPLGNLFAPNASPELRAATVERLSGRFEFVAKALAGKQYLMGEFSAADAYLFVVLNWTNFLKIDLSKWPVLKEYMGRVASRPAVTEALKAEGLTK